MFQDREIKRKLIFQRVIKIMFILIAMEMYTAKQRMDGNREIKVVGHPITKLSKEIRLVL